MFNDQIQNVIDRVDAIRHEVDDAWQIPAHQALVLAQVVRIGRFKSLLEVGVSYGFSTLHLAAAAREHGGHVHAIDISEKKITAATGHLTQAGLLDSVTLHLGDARAVLKTLQPVEPIDFIFNDADKAQAIAYLEAAQALLADRCVVALDNTDDNPATRPCVEWLREAAGGRSCNVSVGNGFELAILERHP